MNKLIILILLSMVTNISRGQEIDLEKFETNFIQIRQKPGTDDLLKDYLSRAGSQEDTLYAFVYSPGQCPRCEGMIKEFHRQLLNNKRKLLLITLNADEKVSKLYNKKKDYEAEYYIYDTDKSIAKFFSFNTSVLGVAYILKISKNGRLISGGDDSFMSSKFVKQLIEKKEPLPYMDFSAKDNAKKKFLPAYKLPAKIMKRNKDIAMSMPDSIWLCGINERPVWYENHFYYADEVLEGMELFQESDNEMRFKALFKPTKRESMRFVKISKEDYEPRKRSGMFFNIVISGNPLDTNHYGISCSLPELEYIDDGIVYYNSACILSRRMDNEQPDSAIVFDFEVDKSKYFFKHFNFSSTGDKIVLGCQKLTWPMEFEPKDYKNDVTLDPFVEGFYHTNNPFMAVFDRHTGKLVTQFGQLDKMAEKTRTGYAFVSPRSAVYNDEVAYTDGSSGKIYVVDIANVHKNKACYEIFKIEDSDLPPLDSTQYYKDTEYMMPYWRVFCRNIDDIRLTTDYLYCVVAYGNFYERRTNDCDATFVRVNRKTRKVEQWAFPKDYGIYKLFARGLRTTTDGKVYPFAVLKTKDEALLRTFYPY